MKRRSRKRRSALGPQGEKALTKRRSGLTAWSRDAELFRPASPRPPEKPRKRRIEVLPAPPPQRKLAMPPVQRVATRKSLAVAPSKRKRVELFTKEWREEICREYDKRKRGRREVMFAKGAAGRSKRPGAGKKRRPDWRREFCK